MKPLLRHTIYRPGNVVTIFRGPSHGLRYRIYPTFGLSHLYGGWEAEVQMLLSQIVKPSMVCYDIGANYGMFSLLMARRVGAAGKVFSFEPMPEIGASLEENARLNDLTNMHLVAAAVSNNVGEAQFVVGHHDGAGHLTSAGRGNREQTEKERKVTVSVTTVDAFVAEGNPLPDLMKIDIEGAESAALEGARQTLAARKPLLMIELHTPTEDVKVGALLRAAGYQAFRVDEPGLPAVKDMSKGFPEPDGMRGYVLGIHESRLVNGRPVL